MQQDQTTAQDEPQGAPQSTSTLQAQYFDGVTAKAYLVTVVMDRVGVTIHDAIGVVRQEPWLQVEVSERTRHAPRRILFKDNATLEFVDPGAFDEAYKLTGQGESWVVSWQQNWGRTFAAFAITVAVLAAGYVWGLPAFATVTARLVPDRAQQALGEQVLRSVDGRMLKPTKLPAERQQALQKAFEQAVQAYASANQQRVPPYRLYFRQSTIGPNAFALPGGIIVMTDELVNIAPSDEGVLGVLAHELGHLHHNHMMQRVIASSVIGIVTFTVFGDASTIVIGLSTALLDANYSREAEREADRYALDFMRKARISPIHMAQMFRAMQDYRGPKPDKKGSPVEQGAASEVAKQTNEQHSKQDEKIEEAERKAQRGGGYFDSHPATEERIRMFETQ